MPGPVLGYCTNVHPGADWAQARVNLQTHAAAVKQLASPDTPLPVGLWLAHSSLHDLLADDNAADLAQLCNTLGLVPFTFNGFPFGNFHQPVVKHAVYEPGWDRPERLAYTLDLAALHAALADGPCVRSISTVPLGWGDPARSTPNIEAAVAHLQDAATSLARLHDETGVLVHLDIEPEPGCLVERSEDVVHLFERLVAGADESAVRTHLRVCHDICHAAVMFEDQAHVLSRYRSAGIRVGKVHISSALQLDLSGLNRDERQTALAELRTFAEDRYLHQTMVADNSQRTFYQDLPEALAHAERGGFGDQWRVHYHVPIFLDRIGSLQTTQDQIDACLAAISPDDGIEHFEVETYTWNVLPPAMRSMSLAQGIAREIQWAQQRLSRWMPTRA